MLGEVVRTTGEEGLMRGDAGLAGGEILEWKQSSRLIGLCSSSVVVGGVTADLSVSHEN